jgi:phosphoribosylformimino-5-aminoimidazole carboxamide ribonucleotide (ProFAR) isomerase
MHAPTINMTRFRPCIDLHKGAVKQIVGGTLTDDGAGLKENFTSEHPSSYYAELYRKHDLRGGHVIMLGPGNTEAAREALAAWPQGLQIGGGIKDVNAKEWIDAGAEKVCCESARPHLHFLVLTLSSRSSLLLSYFLKVHSPLTTSNLCSKRWVATPASLSSI